MTETIEIVAVLITGSLLGAEFAVAAFANPVFAGLPDEAFRVARSDASRLLGRVMPFWYAATLAALVLVTAVARSWLTGIAAVLMTAVVLLSVIVLVPINNRIGTGDFSRALARRWDRLHWVRVAILATLFVALTAACFG
ncbi:membrane protein [Mycobacterium sp. MFM001]|uniref:anthrone oxygenase family protein n=1 Tax=Mycobacterium sp. MFM001 TaxID=2049453 RepID=UPI000DA55252|nr:anthrone oxygenase family protein [Mycobacterium sp. MFM001]GBE66792.1 membrane protein [Mycobacterium sp. MFM001]